ncbi:HAD family hydrolase [Jannaschia donghaensis]|uniref:Phosphorylated carbohydrates phosphatase n=1 Tax=Jannaschia donghaensis TaxID=420998 RepID=A0A0M6YHQ2_9RHOB|nr:HAD-IA family hydrolase [Jannaschia donghaensis]CTQ49882.1 Phosphorylated carbohydrates phosphatase [Jannaschia donghaensis]
MKALLLGSIGTLSDTSELQREAFNAAFLRHGLDWSWDRDDYRDMLRASGGQDRIETQAAAEGISVDAAAIHATKSAMFQEMLNQGRADPRPGVMDAIERARADGTKLGFVTTTSRANVDSVLAALDIVPETFDIITSSDDVTHGKPASEVYHLAAERLAVSRADCTVVEDNVGGVRAALDAGMACIAWPNENTADHDFGGVRVAGTNLGDTLYPATADAR